MYTFLEEKGIGANQTFPRDGDYIQHGGSFFESEFFALFFSGRE
jgi:hypothetical protein